MSSSARYYAHVSFTQDERSIYRPKGWGGHPVSTYVPLPKGAGYNVAEFNGTRYYQVIIESSNERVGAYAEHLFTSIEAAQEFMKTLPTVLTWQQEVEYAGIPLEAEELFISKCSEGLFGVFRNSEYGTRLVGEKHKRVRNACLEFWAIVEEKAQSNKKDADSFTKERFTSYGESPDNFIDWVIGGYPPGEYWKLFN